MTPSSPHRRRWFQISLRTLLILVTLAACGFGWLGHKVRQAQRQKEAVESLRRLDWIVQYDYELDSDGSYRQSATSPGPVWLRRVLGDDFFANVHAVYCLMMPGTDADLAHLREFTQLEVLYLNDTQVTDSGLVHLRGLAQLKALSLSRTQITDSGLVHLEGLTKLDTLHIDHTRITDSGLAHLGELTRLKELQLHCTRITDVGLVQLQGLSRLAYLNVNWTQVSDQGRRELQEALPDMNFVKWGLPAP